MLTIVVFEIKEGKNAQRDNPQKIFDAISCILSIQKIKILLTIIYHYLVVEKLT